MPQAAPMLVFETLQFFSQILSIETKSATLPKCGAWQWQAGI